MSAPTAVDTAWETLQGILTELDGLGFVVFRAEHNPAYGRGTVYRRTKRRAWRETDDREFVYRAKWSKLTHDTNADRIKEFTAEDRIHLVMDDRVAEVETDGDDGDALKAKLVELGVVIFLELASPGGGRKFLIPNHPALRWVGQDKNVDGWPAIEVKRSGNFTLYARRPKYDGRGYTVETNHLCVLLSGVDNSGTGRFAQYLAPRLPQRREYVFTEKVEPDNVTDQDVKWALATVECVLGDFAKIDNGRWQAGNNAGLKVGHVAWALVGHFGGPEQAHDYVVGRFLHACQANGWLDKRGEVSATKTFDYGFFDGAQEPKERPVTEPGVPAPLAPTDWFMQEWRGSKAVESTDTVEPPSERPVTEESVEDDAWELQPLSAVVSERPRWVWNPNGTGGMQLATLGILVGSSEAGKSTMARFFCAGFTRGTIVGEWHATPVSVLYYASEESFENVIKGSLQAHGADMDRVFRHPDGAIKGIADEKKIIATCRTYGIKVIVLDPLITTFDNSTNGDKTAEVRRELEAWHRIAVAIEGIVIGIAHSKKEFRGDALASINGSVAFGEVCRWAFFFVRDKDDAGHRVMSQCKSSVGSGGVHLDYEIHGVKLVDDSGEPMEMGAVTLKGESETTAEQVAWRNSEKPKSGDGASTELEVMEWLNTLLKDGPVWSVDAESHPDNIWAKNTVSKYRKKAGIESKRVDGSWYWATAEQVATGTEPHKEQS